MTTINKVSETTLYADATADLDNSQIVIFGVPFDGTSSHRAGSAKAPMAIRQESYNFETYLNRYDLDFEKLSIHDLGNSKQFGSVKELIKELPDYFRKILEMGKFLMTLGGEHSITIPIVQTLHELNPDKKLGLIYLDAHLDFRDSYLDEKFSHACVGHRLSEIVGIENIVEIGIRSYSAEEADFIRNNDLKIYSSDDVREIGMDAVIKEALNYLKTQYLYLSVDMDVFDPAFAPGVGNPEYFGLTPWQIRECIESIGQYLIGADIVEVSPPYDNGNTAALAAQLIQIIISQAII